MKIRIHLVVLMMFLFGNSMNAFSQQTNFSGSWIINEAQSDFNNQKHDVMFRQIKVTQTKDSLRVEGIRFDNSKGTTITSYPINGNHITIILTAAKKMEAYLKWTVGKTLTRYSSYYADDSGKIEYRSEEVWNLSEKGKTLTLRRSFFRVADTVGIKAVYEKQ